MDSDFDPRDTANRGRASKPRYHLAHRVPRHLGLLLEDADTAALKEFCHRTSSTRTDVSMKRAKANTRAA